MLPQARLSWQPLVTQKRLPVRASSLFFNGLTSGLVAKNALFWLSASHLVSGKTLAELNRKGLV